MNTDNTLTGRRFAVTPPPAYATWTIVMLGVAVPLIAIAIGYATAPRPLTDLAQAWPLVVILPLTLGVMLFALKRRSVELASGMLDVRAALFRQRTPVADIDLERARVVDLAERTELHPLLKTNGMSLPGFQAGRFRLRGQFGKAFCLVTDRRRVLWLPLRDGKAQLLLSLEDPQALLEALRG